MLKFKTVTGATIQIKANLLEEHIYRIDNPDGTITLKYQDIPEFTIKSLDIPSEKTEYLRFEVDVFNDVDAHGDEALLESFRRQIPSIVMKFSVQTREHAEMRITEIGDCGMEGWFGHGRRFQVSIYADNLKLAESYIKGFDYDYFLSLMKETSCKNMPNIPWFGSPDNNPCSQSWNIIGVWHQIAIAITKSKKSSTKKVA